MKRGFIIFGISLTVLAVMIFVWPTLIAFMIATLILMVGVGSLMAAYQFRKHNHRIQQFQTKAQEFREDYRESPNTSYFRRTIFIVR